MHFKNYLNPMLKDGVFVLLSRLVVTEKQQFHPLCAGFFQHINLQFDQFML